MPETRRDGASSGGNAPVCGTGAPCVLTPRGPAMAECPCLWDESSPLERCHPGSADRTGPEMPRTDRRRHVFSYRQAPPNVGHLRPDLEMPLSMGSTPLRRPSCPRLWDDRHPAARSDARSRPDRARYRAPKCPRLWDVSDPHPVQPAAAPTEIVRWHTPLPFPTPKTPVRSPFQRSGGASMQSKIATLL